MSENKHELTVGLIGAGATIIAAIISIFSCNIGSISVADNSSSEGKSENLESLIDDLNNQREYISSLEDENNLLRENIKNLEEQMKETSSSYSNIDSDTSESFALSTVETVQESRWMHDDKGWRLKSTDGTYLANSWEKYDGAWYYFDEAGYMCTGWILSDDGKYFYCDPRQGENYGKLLTNQRTPDGYWVDENGIWTPIETQSFVDETEVALNSSDYESKISIFTMDTFQGKGYWFGHSSATGTATRFTDTYGNEYLTGYFGIHGPKTQNSSTVPTYLLDNKYKLCRGQFAWTKASKNIKGSIWIEFYDGNKLIFQTEPITATDRALSFEFSVEGIETMSIVLNGSNRIAVYAVYPYFDLVE